MRALHVAASVAPEDGGAATAILETVSHLRQAGCDAELLTTDAAGRHDRLSPAQLEEIAAKNGIPVRWRRVHAPRRLKTSLGLAAELRKVARGYDVIHIHGFFLFHTLVASWMANR